ncbi:hypothetical protein CLV43_101710 [Umezawaea tangerina]|uniref:Uncharacterized protein n=1 Tax=Umezawaea tangerina TaxID=84725 RepID=A0A2T0TL38_9PSEU|nr:hypothetical protein CLV43_101710 [Umezawaea tangerina]
MENGNWWVAIEENRGMGDGREWTMSQANPAGDLSAAQAEAMRLARHYAPAYPWSEKARKVLRTNENSYLVIVEGRASTFHFRVTVGELIPDE